MATIDKRVNSKGKAAYRVRVRVKGREPIVQTFPRKADAVEWAAKTETEIREGRYFPTRKARQRTLADLVDRYCEIILPRMPKAKQKRTSQLEWWKGELGDMALADIGPAQISQARDRLAADRSPATVNRYLAALSHAFSIAHKEWGWIQDHPIRKVSRLTEPQGRVRYLDGKEKQKLLRACSEPLRTIVLVAMTTGMRQGELLSLKWKDVDLKRSWIAVHDTKNKERRGVPVAGAALDALLSHAKIRRMDSDLIFPDKGGRKSLYIRRAWDRAIEEAGIEDFKFHDLRHTAASYLAMSGASLSEIAAILGHKTLAMVKRYAHLSDDHQSVVLERMTAKFIPND